MCIRYDNYNELLEDDEKLALELLEEKGKGRWQKEDIYRHYDLEYYAEFELTEGWYCELNLDRGFNGAPNLLHFIDLKELGNALLRNWDNSSHFQSDYGDILQTSYGW